MPERTFATVDHIIPTAAQSRPFADALAEEMAVHLIRNAKDFGVPLFDLGSGRQGIVHVIGPELGLTQPGMTIACGDSHTSTHGAVGAIAFGIGTTPGARRAGHAVPGDGQAEAPPGAGRRAPRARRVRQGRDPLRSSTCWASRAAWATPTSTRARRSSA